MKVTTKTYKTNFSMFTIGVIVTAIVFMYTTNSYGHGGKTHSSESITSLQALQKASAVYDKLIGSKKLVQTWETDLVSVEIQKRNKNGETHFIVSFHRSTGDKKVVYIYLTAIGKYAGSNFDGK